MVGNNVPLQRRNNVPLQRRLLGLEDAAAYLGVSTDTVLGMLERGVVHRVALPGVRRLLLDVRELDEVVEASRQ
jgi:excisionase family DNA binding protein